MKLQSASPAVAVVALFATAVSAGNPDWSPGYPQPGPSSGTIAVQGVITLDPSLTTTGTVNVTAWPVDGGNAVTQTFSIPPGQTGPVNWGPFIVTGLTPGVPYNIFAQVVAMDGTGSTQNLTTDPTQVPAAP